MVGSKYWWRVDAQYVDISLVLSIDDEPTLSIRLDYYHGKMHPGDRKQKE